MWATVTARFVIYRNQDGERFGDTGVVYKLVLFQEQGS